MRAAAAKIVAPVVFFRSSLMLSGITRAFREEQHMAERIRVLQYGLGPIGSAIARHVSQRPNLAPCRFKWAAEDTVRNRVTLAKQ